LSLLDMKRFWSGREVQVFRQSCCVSFLLGPFR